MAACTLFVVSGCLVLALISASWEIGPDSDSFRAVSTETFNETDVSRNNDTSCADVRHVFTSKLMGNAENVPDYKIEGSDLSMCSPSNSCCTNPMEHRYREAVQKDFWIMLQASSESIKSLLTASATKFRVNFLEMIHLSENNTNVLFSEVYKKMDAVAKVPVAQLYNDLSAYLLGQPLELESRISSFFDLLFPLVYHHSINPKLKDFSDDYKECLRQTQQEIRPFGDIADRMSVHVTRSFRAARTLLDALDLGVEVINATDHMDFSENCTIGLVRLVYCAHCKGFPNAKPCSGYCLNVARSCLANVAELDQSWSDYVSALERATVGLVATYNIEEVLSVLDTKVSEAIMYAMENGPELSKRVKKACGHPRRATRDVSEPSVLPAGYIPGRIVSVRTSEDSLYVRLQHVVQKLAETKGQYANLADILCTDDSWAVRKEGQCWNGESLGEYSKTIAGVGIAAQKYNPEMEAPTTDDLVVIALDSRLQRMSQQLRQSVTAEQPQSDAYMAPEGSGSGGWNRIEDDEDYDKGGSGSGDWGGTKPSDFNFDNGDVRHQDIKIKVTDAGMQSCCCNVFVIVLVSVAGFLIQTRFPINNP